MLSASANEMFTFEVNESIQSPGVTVVCTLETLGGGVSAFPISEDLKSFKTSSGGYLPLVVVLKLANPIAKCMPCCRAAGGGPPQETLGNLSITLHY